MHYSNGDKYEGGWKNGKRDGKGLWFAEDGSSYEGELKEGLPHGKGIMTGRDGEKKEAIFFQGEIKK